jgi:hypothetical protein
MSMAFTCTYLDKREIIWLATPRAAQPRMARFRLIFGLLVRGSTERWWR